MALLSSFSLSGSSGEDNDNKAWRPSAESFRQNVQ